MHDTCPDVDSLEEMLNASSDDELTDLSTHVRQCSACHAQWEVHRELVASMRKMPAPELSGQFDFQMTRRLAHVPRRTRLGGTAKTAMTAYWLGVLAASIVLLASVPLSPSPSGVGEAALFLFAVPVSFFALALPSVWRRRLRRIAQPMLT